MTIYLDPESGLPVVDQDTVRVAQGAAVLWIGGHGPDTTWVVRLTGESPFVRERKTFESGPSPSTPVGGVIRGNAVEGAYDYVVKIIVNDGADTLGMDPQILVRDPD